MAYKIKMSKAARKDVDNILEQAPSDKARANFAKTLDKRTRIIQKHPKSAPKIYKDVRVVNFIKLPFKLIYQIIKPSTLLILGILHKKQHIDKVKDRADS